MTIQVAKPRQRGLDSGRAGLWGVCGAATLILAIAATPTAPAGADGRSLQASRQVVTLRVTSEGRELARMSVPERGRARISREGGETLGLTPEVQGDRLKLVVSIQTAYGADGPVYTPFETYLLVADVPTTIDTGRTRFDVEWVPAATKPEPAAVPGEATDGCRECCITCFEFTYCACEVITPCGRCCCPETCGCVIITDNVATPVHHVGNGVAQPAGERGSASGLPNSLPRLDRSATRR